MISPEERARSNAGAAEREQANDLDDLESSPLSLLDHEKAHDDPC